MAVSDLQSLVSTAKTHIGNGAWESAETVLMQAQAELIAIPDGQIDQAEMTFHRETVQSLLTTVRRKVGTATNGIQVQKESPARATS